MPRLNDQRRAQMLAQKLKEYEEQGEADHTNYRFGRDMVARAARGKGFTARQRSWVMSIIEEPVPQPKNLERVQEFRQAAETLGNLYGADVLRDMAHTLSRGYNLSEKQEKFAQSLLEKAQDVADKGRWHPSPEDIEVLRLCRALAANRALWNAPATDKALLKASILLDWIDLHKMDPAEANLKTGLEEWGMQKIRKHFAGRLRKLQEPRHNTGDLRWLRNQAGKKIPLLIVGGPYVTQASHRAHVGTQHLAPVITGDIVYDCHLDGQIIPVDEDSILIRPPRS